MSESYEFSATPWTSVTIDGLDIDREVEICMENDLDCASHSIWLPEDEVRKLCRTLSFMFGPEKHLKGVTLDASRADELHSALLKWVTAGWYKSSTLRHEGSLNEADEVDKILSAFTEALSPFEVKK